MISLNEFKEALFEPPITFIAIRHPPISAQIAIQYTSSSIISFQNNIFRKYQLCA
jgi:hypothetical protein